MSRIIRFVPDRLRFVLSGFKARWEILLWGFHGSPVPPPHAYKRATIRSYRKRFRTRLFIESGTFRGDMVFAQRYGFEAIYSIELDRALYEQAVERFRGFSHIEILQGDSGDVLPVLLAQFDRTCLFWLDGHYSGGGTARGESETPVMKELVAILAHPLQHVILIDDARLFTGHEGYPSIADLREWVARRRPEYTMTVEGDVIRLVGTER